MPGVFTKQDTQHLGSFSSDSAVLTVDKVKLGIVQNAQVQFAQSIARVYDVGNGGGQAATGSVPVWYVGGRTQGQATLARILGPQGDALGDFYKKIGDVCAPQDLTFTFSAGCFGAGTTKSTVYTLKAAVAVNIGISVSAQDMIVNENVSLMFANLDVA